MKPPASRELNSKFSSTAPPRPHNQMHHNTLHHPGYLGYPFKVSPIPSLKLWAFHTEKRTLLLLTGQKIHSESGPGCECLLR